jgi:hypothetical protein
MTSFLSGGLLVKFLALFSLAALLFMSSGTAAFALTTDSGRFSNSDGTAKFSDPDEDKPAFMTGGAQGSQTNPQQPFSMNVTHGQAQSLLPGASMGSRSQSSGDAFDHAFNHQNIQ